MSEIIYIAKSEATIANVIAKKRELEATIAKLIEDFGSYNGVTVEGISLEHDPVMMTQEGKIVNKIRYSVELRIWL
jgi:hypothetical protein